MTYKDSKKIVLRQWPKAHCYKGIGGVFIIWYCKGKDSLTGNLGSGTTPMQAWASAAGQLSVRKSRAR